MESVDPSGVKNISVEYQGDKIQGNQNWISKLEILDIGWSFVFKSDVLYCFVYISAS